MLLILLIMMLILPAFLTYQTKGFFPDALLFIFPFTFVIHFFFTSGIYEEEKSKALELLTTTPYCRKNIVLGKYLSVLLCFFLNVLLAWFLSLVMHGYYPVIDFSTFSVSFFAVSLYVGIFVPVHLLFGAKKMRVIAMVCVIALPYLLPWLFSTFFSKGNAFSDMIPFPMYILYSMLIVFSLAILFASFYLGNMFYSRKDL